MNKAAYYYLSEHSLNGILLHKSDCSYLPEPTDRVFLGSCYSQAQALTVAKNRFSGVTYCPYCLTRWQPDAAHAARYPKVMCYTSKPQPRPIRHLPESE